MYIGILQEVRSYLYLRNMVSRFLRDAVDAIDNFTPQHDMLDLVQHLKQAQHAMSEIDGRTDEVFRKKVAHLGTALHASLGEGFTKPRPAINHSTEKILLHMMKSHNLIHKLEAVADYPVCHHEC